MTFFFLIACSSKEEPCELILDQPNLVTHNSVSVQLRVSGDNISERGLVIGTIPRPTVNDRREVNTSQSSVINFRIDSLQRNMTYYLRGYIRCDGDIIYSNEIGFTTSQFVVLEKGDVVIEVASSDNAQLIPWGPMSQMVGATSSTDGASNTALIAADTSATGSFAANICANYAGNGKNDWYMPSEEELLFLFQHRKEIGNIRPGAYWSSTETSPNSAKLINMISGQSQDAPKDQLADCRCIRVQ
ncbi:MAG: DUF1566 domain-containing protein [Flavobacteriales bacterium]|nr:MAG: DUF1566 domain-containing protein [Flavobacteriales bacterium]